MNVSILCSNSQHPVIPHLQGWLRTSIAKGHEVHLIHDKSELRGGDVLFLVSCAQIVRSAERATFKATLVLHASDLPVGRGWSPHIWSILGGATELTVCLLEAAEPVDSGAIWLKTTISLGGYELLPEIEEKIFAAELLLMTQAIDNFSTIRPVPQAGEPGPYLRRRTPADSRLDPAKSIGDQFDLLRVVDARRFPAFFEYRGHRYLIRIEKDER